MKRLLTVVPGLALLCAVPVVAHHSFAAEFDVNQPITLTGKLTGMEWLNPHGWLLVDVTQPDGTVVNWAIEVGAPNALLRRGLRRTDFPIGSELGWSGSILTRHATGRHGCDRTRSCGVAFGGPTSRLEAAIAQRMEPRRPTARP